MVDPTFEAMMRAFTATEPLPDITDRLVVLGAAWLLLANNARTDAIPFPGGFPAEQQRQIEHLEKC